jgi:hypothetical protein
MPETDNHPLCGWGKTAMPVREESPFNKNICKNSSMEKGKAPIEKVWQKSREMVDFDNGELQGG